MANYDGLITNFVAGDNLQIARTITGLISPLVKAWLTIKRSVNDLDADAVLQKSITSILSADGQIDDTGVDATGHIYFLLSANDTVLLNPLSEYRYDIQIKTNDGSINTPEIGIITSSAQVTRSTV